MKARTILAVAATVAALAACSSTRTVPGPTVTVTATATRPVPGPTHTVYRTRTKKVAEPAPTVTVTEGSRSADRACIAYLYQDIANWYQNNNRVVPNGWWDSRCPIP